LALVFIAKEILALIYLFSVSDLKLEVNDYKGLRLIVFYVIWVKVEAIFSQLTGLVLF
jgi:hypothetical protein